jgi:hypothetical protein
VAHAIYNVYRGRRWFCGEPQTVKVLQSEIVGLCSELRQMFEFSYAPTEWWSLHYELTRSNCLVSYPPRRLPKLMYHLPSKALENSHEHVSPRRLRRRKLILISYSFWLVILISYAVRPEKKTIGQC